MGMLVTARSGGGASALLNHRCSAAQSSVMALILRGGVYQPHASVAANMAYKWHLHNLACGNALLQSAALINRQM